MATAKKKPANKKTEDAPVADGPKSAAAGLSDEESYAKYGWVPQK